MIEHKKEKRIVLEGLIQIAWGSSDVTAGRVG
jgi:hypothetical protein